MTTPLRVLVGFECSGMVRRAFAALGHDAWSIDLKPSEDRSNRHIVGDIRDHLSDGWDLLAVLHPPCTRLTNSGVRWLSVPPPGRTLDEMVELLNLTPFARTEFVTAWDDAADDVERARRLVIRSFMGFGSNAHSDKGRGAKTTGFRANSSRSGTTPAHDWHGYPSALPTIIERLRGVVIEQRPALQVMEAHDWPDTLHYVDPPYLHSTRSRKNIYDAKHQYRHELTDAEHVHLLGRLRELTGMVVLSGYPDDAYDHILVNEGGWHRFEREALADGARPRIEVVWINPACMSALAAEGRSMQQLELLEAAE